MWLTDWDLDRHHEGDIVGISPRRGQVEVGGRPTWKRGSQEAGWDVIGWAATCSCGWTGETWKRVLDPAEADPKRRTVLGDEFGNPTPELIEETRKEWWRHAGPETVQWSIMHQTRLIEKARAERDLAVQAARLYGVSWEKIGRKAGMSRQAAQERWAVRLLPPEADGSPARLNRGVG